MAPNALSRETAVRRIAANLSAAGACIEIADRQIGIALVTDPLRLNAISDSEIGSLDAALAGLERALLAVLGSMTPRLGTAAREAAAIARSSWEEGMSVSTAEHKRQAHLMRALRRGA